jgi:hypothetical protein
MRHVYIDESGELGFAGGSSHHFLIAALCTQEIKALGKCLKKAKAQLYADGWPRDIEIKGATVWGSPHNAKIPKTISDRRITILERIVSSICSGNRDLHYSITKKKHLSDSKERR